MLCVLVIVLFCCNICFMLDPLENEMVHHKGLSINKKMGEKKKFNIQIKSFSLAEYDRTTVMSL